MYHANSVPCICSICISTQFCVMVLFQCLTGGKKGGVHCTDVTNDSRTMLVNIHTMEWDPELCKYGEILRCMHTVMQSRDTYN